MAFAYFLTKKCFIFCQRNELKIDWFLCWLEMNFYFRNFEPSHKNDFYINKDIFLTDTSEFAPKWTRVHIVYFRLGAESYSSLGRVGKKRRKILASTFGRFPLWTSFDFSPVSVKISISSFFILVYSEWRVTAYGCSSIDLTEQIKFIFKCKSQQR